MKKTISLCISIFLIICLIVFLIFPEYTKNVIYDSLYLWLTKVLLSLVPFYLISNLLLSFPFFSKLLYFPLTKIMHFENQKACSLFLLSFITGNPTSSILIINSINHGISKKEGERLLKGAVLNSPLFTILMLPKPYGYFVYFIQILISTLFYIFNKPKKLASSPVINDSNNNCYCGSKSLLNVIDDCPLVMINILASMFFVSTIKIPFSLLINNLDFFNNNIILKSFVCFFLDSFELTTGLNSIIDYQIPLFIKLIICSFMMSFGGLAINIQIANVAKKTSLKVTSLVLSRIIHGIITAIIFSLIFLIFFI